MHRAVGHRDAEIESTIRGYADPLFRAAGLDPAGIRVLLVNDDSINAFVAGGMRLFINTGLLMRADTPNQVKGVIAHETGHIAHGDISRLVTQSDARRQLAPRCRLRLRR